MQVVPNLYDMKLKACYTCIFDSLHVEVHVAPVHL